jgi:hypothetical protein
MARSPVFTFASFGTGAVATNTTAVERSILKDGMAVPSSVRPPPAGNLSRDNSIERQISRDVNTSLEMFQVGY